MDTPIIDDSKNGLLNILNLDVILIIANFLPTSLDVENFCVDTYLKKNLAQIINNKSIQELEKVMFARPWYPVKVKEQIYEEENVSYENTHMIQVYFQNENIGYVRRGHIITSHWCGYYYLPDDIGMNIDFDRNADLLNKTIWDIGFKEEITYNGKRHGKYTIGWDHAHWGDGTIEGYYTLEAVIDEVKCCHKKVLMNKKILMEKCHK
jgi:hypothetical protein